MSQKVKTMFGVSEETAGIIYDISWWIAIVAAAFSLLGLLVQFKAEKRLDEFRDARDQQTAIAVATANESAAKANLDLEKIKKENLQLSLKLESERSERIALEMAIAPRSIATTKTAEALKKFKGIRVIISAPDDAECQNLEGQIAALVEQAGWTLIERQKSSLMPIPSSGVIVQNTDGAGDAAKELVTQLKINSNIDADLKPIGHPKTPPTPNMVMIHVRPNRPRYFQDKQMQKAIDSMDADSRKAMQDMLDRAKHSDHSLDGGR